MLTVLLIGRRRGNRCRVCRSRLVRERTRHAARVGAAHLFAGVDLTRAHHRLSRIAVRAVLLFGLFFIREVNLRGHLRMHVAVTDNRAEDRFNATLETVFYVCGIFQLRVVQVTPGGIGLGQQVSALIDHRHVTRWQTGDGAGDEMRHRADLPFVQRAARFEVHGHGS